MALVAYRQAGITSRHGEALLSQWFGENINKASKDKWLAYFPIFESSCIVSSFETALLSFPFDIPEECVEDLERVYNHIRSTVLGEIGENVRNVSGKANDKNSANSAKLLLEIMLNSTMPQQDIERLVINLAK